MAVSKSTRGTRPRTNLTAEFVLRTSNISAERRRSWKMARGKDRDALRFPAYEHLYLLNFYTEQLIGQLRMVGGPLSDRHQATIQQVRSEASQHVLEIMNAVEITDAFLQEQLGKLDGY